MALRMIRSQGSYLRMGLLVFAIGLYTVSTGVAEEDSQALRVGVRVAAPFAYQPQENGPWRGLAIELWEAMAERLELEYTYVPMPLNRLLDATAAGEVDVGIGALSVLPEREQRMDFTHAFMNGGLGIAAKVETAGLWTALLRLVSVDFLKVVAALSGILFFFGFFVWLFERKRNAQFGGSRIEGIGSGFWWSAVTMTTVGYGDKSPVTLPGRLVALVWMFSAIIMISGFTGAIASSLTVGSLQGKVRGLDDLPSVRVAAVDGSTSALFLRDQRIAFTPVHDVDEAMEGLLKDRYQAIVHDRPILHHMIQDRRLANVAVLPERFERQLYAFVMPLGGELRKDLNVVLLEVTNSPQWIRLLEQYLGDRLGD
jgi:polar amino acid transport system substrate-binding protein